MRAKTNCSGGQEKNVAAACITITRPASVDTTLGSDCAQQRKCSLRILHSVDFVATRTMEIGKSQNMHLRQTLLGNAIYFQAQGGYSVQWGLHYDIGGFVKKALRLWLNQDG